MTRSGIRTILASMLATAAIGWATPALAQNGTLLGRVVDSDRRATDRDGKPLGGKPKDYNDREMGVGEAYVTLELKGDAPKKFQTLTDAFGDFYKAGLPPGTYDISIKKEWRDPVPGRTAKLVIFTAELNGVVLKPGEKLKVPDIAAFTEEARAAGKGKPGTTTAAVAASPETDAANKRAAEVNALAKDADDAFAAGKYDEAITMLMNIVTKRAEKNETCAACYTKIGESQLKLNAADKAEAAFLKAIEQDPKLRDPYVQLASLYNSQRKFEDAAKMSAKASELAGAGAGGGDAQSVFNAGIINWNAGKYPEARDEFAKAVKLDPKMAEAHYRLGMAIFNLASSNKANLADAKAPFQEYLKLAPTGEFAEVAKAILATIK